MTDATQPVYGDWITTERNRMLADAEARDALEFAPDLSQPNHWTTANERQMRADNADDNEDDGFWLNLMACAAFALALGGTVWWAIRLIGSVW